MQVFKWILLICVPNLFGYRTPNEKQCIWLVEFQSIKYSAQLNWSIQDDVMSSRSLTRPEEENAESRTLRADRIHTGANFYNNAFFNKTLNNKTFREKPTHSQCLNSPLTIHNIDKSR